MKNINIVYARGGWRRYDNVKNIFKEATGALDRSSSRSVWITSKSIRDIKLVRVLFKNFSTLYTGSIYQAGIEIIDFINECGREVFFEGEYIFEVYNFRSF